MTFAIYLAIFFFLIITYIRIAQRLQIADTPNQRSSHTAVTVRGAGIIFPFGLIFPAIFLSKYNHQALFLAGLLLISAISFIDDLRTLNSKWRIMIQCAAVILLMWQTGLFDIGIFLLFVTFIFVVGMINAFNFMDGINGITALYSLAIIASLYFINQFIIPFIESEYFVSIIASLLAFSFFNVRKKAKAFAGDVGSVSIAFIISFLLIKLMIQTQSAVWILLLSIYGIDAVCTICFRIIRRENIFNAHRSHFYQFLANEMNFKHVAVSSVYASVQLILNFIIIYSYVNHQIYIPLVCFFALIISYLISRFILEGKTKLLIRY